MNKKEMKKAMAKVEKLVVSSIDMTKSASEAYIDNDFNALWKICVLNSKNTLKLERIIKKYAKTSKDKKRLRAKIIKRLIQIAEKEGA